MDSLGGAAARPASKTSNGSSDGRVAPAAVAANCHMAAAAVAAVALA